MRIGKWAQLLLAAAPLLAGCGDFWQAPGTGTNTDFSLTNSGSITVSPGATTNNASTITVTPANSFTGTVSLSCAITSAPSSAASPTTCTLSPTSVSITGTSAQTATLTATTTATTTTGTYEITVTGVSGSVAETTQVCVDVTTSSTGSCTSASTSGNFYILNGGTTPEIVGESISSGSITSISGSPWTLSSTPYSMAIAPNGNFLVVSTETAGVYAFPIKSGVLGTGVLVSPDQAYAIQVDKSNSWLIEAIQGNGRVQLNAIPINSTTGAFIIGDTVPTAFFSVASATLQKNRMVISPDNSNIFVPLGAGGTIVVPFNKSNPLPSSGVSYITIPVVNSNGSALSVAVDPSTTPRLFYIGETFANSAGTSGAVRAFTYASLSTSPVTLVPATNSPIASGGLAPNFILPVANPDYVYVANGAGSGNAGNITGFAISGSASPYSIATGSSVATGDQPLGLAEDSTDSFVFVVGSFSPYFDSYTFDSTTTGQLDSQITSGNATSAIAIVAAP